MAFDVSTSVSEYVAPPRPVGAAAAPASSAASAAADRNDNASSWTPAMCAAFAGKIEELEALGLTSLGPDKTGLKPMHLAALRGHCDSIELLLRLDPESLEAVERHGRTPLMFAATGGHADAIELLVGKGASIDAQSKDGKTALHWATVAHRLDAIRALVAAGASDEIRQGEREPLIPGKHEPGATPHGLANGRNDRDPVLRHVSKYYKALREARATGGPAPTLPEPEWIAAAKVLVERQAVKATAAEAGGGGGSADATGVSEAAPAGSMWDDEEPIPAPVTAPAVEGLHISSFDFVPAATFSGHRPQCVFKAGERGMGYYRDLRAAVPAGEALGGGPASATPDGGMGQLTDGELKEMLALAKAAKDEPGELDDLD
jgi:hypothetical protein